ncbi:MAG: hypothetical protein QOE51_119 [Actinoplanes sp.]|nr:hypothetical protein [Actinoplanes sp.]
MPGGSRKRLAVPGGSRRRLAVPGSVLPTLLWFGVAFVRCENVGHDGNTQSAGRTDGCSIAATTAVRLLRATGEPAGEVQV